MKTKWWNHLSNPKDIENFKAGVENSKFVLDRLIKICYNMIEESEKSKLIDYDNPSWAYKQADRLGYSRALKDVINLLQIDQKETT